MLLSRANQPATTDTQCRPSSCEGAWRRELVAPSDSQWDADDVDAAASPHDLSAALALGMVRSARGALPALLLVGFPGPPPE